MSIGRALTILNLYDILANLIPGVAWVLIVTVLFPGDWLSPSPSGTPGLFVAAVIVFGFIVGHTIQWVGSRFDQRLQQRNHDGEDLFGRTMTAIDNGDDDSPIGELTCIEESFCELAEEQFDLPDDFSNPHKILFLVLSYLETRPATRAVRFQSIHAFHRSMWAASILAFLSVLLALLLMAGGIMARDWIPPLVILLGSLGSTCVFCHRKNKFEKTFLRYVFLDFYQDQKVKETQ